MINKSLSNHELSMSSITQFDNYLNNDYCRDIKSVVDNYKSMMTNQVEQLEKELAEKNKFIINNKNFKDNNL